MAIESKIVTGMGSKEVSIDVGIVQAHAGPALLDAGVTGPRVARGAI